MLGAHDVYCVLHILLFKSCFGSFSVTSDYLNYNGLKPYKTAVCRQRRVLIVITYKKRNARSNVCINYPV